MTDPFQPVAGGEPVRPAVAFSAAFRNATIEAIRHARLRQPTPPRREGIREEPDVIWVQNISTTDRDRGDVMAVTKPVFDEDDHELEYTNNLTMEAVVPRECDTGQFVVLLDAIRSQSFGRAVISGLAQVKVDFGIDGSFLDFADVKSGTAILEARSTGSAQILWAKSRSGVQPCVVRLSNNPDGRLTSVCSSLSTFSSTFESTTQTSESSSPATSSASSSPGTSSATSSPGSSSDVTSSASSSPVSSPTTSQATSSSTSGGLSCTTDLGGRTLTDLPLLGGRTLTHVLGLDDNGCLVRVPVSQCATASSSSSTSSGGE